MSSKDVRSDGYRCTGGRLGEWLSDVLEVHAMCEGCGQSLLGYLCNTICEADLHVRDVVSQGFALRDR